MKKSILFGLLVVLLTACGGNTQKNNQQSSEPGKTKTQLTDAFTVNVYYFHGKQRCKTCVAVGDVTEKTIKELYANNPHVKFIEVIFSCLQVLYLYGFIFRRNRYYLRL